MSSARSNARTRTLAAAATGLLLALLGLALLDSPLTRLSYDRTFLLAPPTSPLPSPVAIVYLDRTSHLRENQPEDAPWDRALHAQLLDRLTRAGARAVVFDIVFSEPGRSTEADQLFAESLRRNGRTLLAAELEAASRIVEGEPGLPSWTLVLPREPFRKAAAGWGIAKLSIDEDFVSRRHFAGLLEQDQPSLTQSVGRFLGLPSTASDKSEGSPRWLRYYGPPVTLPHVSYSDALRTEAVGDEFFRDRLVFVGARPAAGTFAERKDEFRSPFSSWGRRDLFMPAVEVHATQMLNLVRGDWLRRLPAPGEAFLLVLASGLAVAALFPFRPLHATGIALVGEFLLLVLISLAYRNSNLWFPWLIVAAVQIPGALAASSLHHSLDWYHTRARLEKERRAAEARVREQAALLDKARDAILVQDLSGRIVYANPSAQRLYGWSRDELAAEGILDQIAAPDAARFNQARRHLLENGEWNGELEQSTRNGQRLVMESRWTLIRDAQGTPRSVLLINTDITEKKRLEAQFLRAQRMETIGSLAGGMAHDLNNALSPILMGVQLLQRKSLDDESRQMLDVIETNTHRGADMVRQVLLFSRGQAGDLDRIDAAGLLREIERIARQTFPKSISVAALCPADLWPVRGNLTQLHQVLLNLCVNARDAMPGGGSLTLAADNVTLTPEDCRDLPQSRPGDFVLFLASDTGTGIAPEILPRLFEPFFTTKPLDQGTGLGLATAARIVRSHQGFLTVKSEPGTGTTFEIYLPRADTRTVSPAAKGAEHAEPPRGNGQLLLLVDDDRSLLDVAATSLVDHGYQVVTATSGIDAVTRFDRIDQPPDLALIDLDMPDLDGRKTLEALRRHSPGLRVVFMSGQPAPTPLTDVRFLPKPFGREELLSLVDAELQKESTATSGTPNSDRLDSCL